MSPGEQIRQAWLVAPASPRLLRRRGWAWLAAYVALAGTIVWVGATLLARNQRDIVSALAAYVFPDRWRAAAEIGLDLVVRTQARDVLVNFIIAATVTMVQLLLFPVKEKLSATFEEEAGLVGERGPPMPLLREGLEEVKLALLFLVAQGTIFWIGYDPSPWRKGTAAVLSYLYLFGTFGVDFVSPLLTRHGIRYAHMAKTQCAHGLAVLGFGRCSACRPSSLGGSRRRWGWRRARGSSAS